MFRVQAKNFSITYPQCDLSRQEALDFYLSQAIKPNFVLVAQEQHNDGGNHLHLAVSFAKRRDLRNPRCWDIRTFHPNIQSSRNFDDWIEYILKEDSQVLQWGTNPHRNYWREAVAAPNREEFMSLLQHGAPRDFILHQDKLAAFADIHWSRRREPYVPRFGGFQIPPDLGQWLEEQFDNPERPLSLILESPSRYGKTEWARSLGRHMYYNAYFNLDDWDADAKYIIFDDLPWERVPAKKAFFGAQRQFTLTDKYRRKITVHWGKPLIFLCNRDSNFLYSLPEEERQWFFSNSHCVTLNKPLFSPS